MRLVGEGKVWVGIMLTLELLHDLKGGFEKNEEIEKCLIEYPSTCYLYFTPVAQKYLSM